MIQWVIVLFPLQLVFHISLKDIVPRHGFLAKPSTLWPNPTIPESGGRVVPTMPNMPPPPGNPDTLKPSLERLQGKRDEGVDDCSSNPGIEPDSDEAELKRVRNWEPKPPKVLMENSNAVPLELRSQIQMYAPTE